MNRIRARAVFDRALMQKTAECRAHALTRIEKSQCRRPTRELRLTKLRVLRYTDSALTGGRGDTEVDQADSTRSAGMNHSKALRAVIGVLVVAGGGGNH